MPLNIEEIRRVELLEDEVGRLKALVDHAYSRQDWERPPVPDYRIEYGLRDQAPPAIPPAAVEAVFAQLSEADKKAFLDLFARALAPTPAPTPAPPTAPPTTPSGRKPS